MEEITVNSHIALLVSQNNVDCSCCPLEEVKVAQQLPVQCSSRAGCPCKRILRGISGTVFRQIWAETSWPSC
ncbi:hypothetical protein RRG08_061584 [Elysia crispata]|uniref:Uncharacterized protein n=1 Tax=Elysia crispata TaxID=231223 RepID=A0AAE1D3Z5_9GAST|nr:hypothetical protein RRG08_061584 [Elysia crispata]